MKGKQTDPQLQVQVQCRAWERTLQGETVLRCEMSWPELSGTWRGLPAIARYYRRVEREWERRWERELYLMACLEFADRRAQGKPFRVWTARLTTCVTRQEGGLLSLWQEGEERQGFERPEAVRRGDTWSLDSGAPVSLCEVCGRKRGWKRRLLEQVETQVCARLEEGASLLDSDCARRLRRAFCPERFYLSGEGVTLFYPMYCLGAGSEGTPEFSVTVR